MPDATGPTRISREPWWHTAPRPGQDEMSLVWEWLEVWSDGSVTVDHDRPTDDEIRNRKSCRLDN